MGEVGASPLGGGLGVSTGDVIEVCGLSDSSSSDSDPGPGEGGCAAGGGGGGARAAFHQNMIAYFIVENLHSVGTGGGTGRPPGTGGAPPEPCEGA